MVGTNTQTSSNTWTKTRSLVIDDHFELFFRCAGISDSDTQNLLRAVDKKEIQAVGAYIANDGYRIAEVELEIDWKEHMELVQVHGSLFDTDLPGWKKGVAPEAYVAVGRLSNIVKERGLPLRTWIRVSEHIRKISSEHQRVCNELGYEYGGTIEPWKEPPSERARQINGLPEGKVTSREAR